MPTYSKQTVSSEHVRKARAIQSDVLRLTRRLSERSLHDGHELDEANDYDERDRLRGYVKDELRRAREEYVASRGIASGLSVEGTVSLMELEGV